MRDKTDDIVEKRKLGKLGMKEQPLIGQILNPVETTRYRALATANFLAIDRGDIVYCAKELTRHMATPTTADWEKVVRLGRCLKNRPRVRLWYKFQETPCQLETIPDTDWAGCRRTRRSTTGGYKVAGSHLIRMWCKTPAVVALSSAEAALYGLGRASAETMGLISMYTDLGTHMNGVVLGDASAALAIVALRGLGKKRHQDTHYLWIQDNAAKGDLNFKKVAGVDNGADIFTKTLSRNEIQSLIHKLSSQFIQNEVNVDYVGARPKGANLLQVLQELGVAGGRNLAAWTRTDMSSRTTRTNMKGGPVWSDVFARVTADAVNGEILDSELARDFTRSLEHTSLEGGPRDIQTILVFEASKVKSPSPILQDSVRRGIVRGYGKYNSGNSCDH